MKDLLYFLLKRNQVSFLFIAVFMFAAIPAAAQPPSEVYARVVMLKVEAGKHAEFEQFSKETMKPIHAIRREKGKIFLWILFRVHFAAAADEYNYVEVHYYPSWEETEMNLSFPALAREAHPQTDPASITAKLLELRSVSRVHLVYRANVIEPTPPVPSKYVRLDYMKVKPGQTTAYLKVERDDWMPFHKTLINNGQSTGWALWRRVFPGGSDAEYDYVTSNRYANYADVMAVDYEKTFKVASPSKNINDIFGRTGSSRDLVKSELWEVVDILN